MKRWVKDLRLRWLIWRMTPEQRKEYKRRLLFEHTRMYSPMRTLFSREPQAIRFPTRKNEQGEWIQ